VALLGRRDAPEASSLTEGLMTACMGMGTDWRVLVAEVGLCARHCNVSHRNSSPFLKTSEIVVKVVVKVVIR